MKEPSEPVVIVLAESVDFAVMLTVAFGITAPDSSVTVPVIVPVGPWANTQVPARAKIRSNERSCSIVFKVPPLIKLDKVLTRPS